MKVFFTTLVSDTDSGRAMTERRKGELLFLYFRLSSRFPSLSTCVFSIASSGARIGRNCSSNRVVLRGRVARGEKKKETATHLTLWVGPKRDVDWFIVPLHVAALVLRNFEE